MWLLWMLIPIFLLALEIETLFRLPPLFILQLSFDGDLTFIDKWE